MRARADDGANDPRPVAVVLGVVSGVDVTLGLRSSLGAPTLILHQHADPWVRVEHGRYLAGHIPGATYVELGRL